MRITGSFIYFCWAAFLFFTSHIVYSQAYTIQTFAGSGTNGYSGDGGFAVDAELNNPCGVAIDTLGNIYIADNGLNVDCIRKINNSGIISTMLGGRSEDYLPDDDAIIDEVNYPSAIAVDKQGNVYITDKTNNRVRKISTNNIITTIAGNGTKGYSGDGADATLASVNYPTGIAADNLGNIYIADAGNNRVRKINKTGIISTIAGNGIAGYGGDNGPATSAKLNYPISVSADAFGNLYIADEGNNRIRKINASGSITTVAGNGKQGYSGDGKSATEAELGNPTGVSADNAGNIYISDWANNCIRKVDATGIITTIAGDGKPGYCGDGEAATKAELLTPYRVSVDATGNIYIVDYGNHRIREINKAGVISTIAGNGAQNYFGNNGPPKNAELDFPSGIAIDPAGNVYCADKLGQRIHKINTSGIISILAGDGKKGYSGDGKPAVKARINSPSGMASDIFGNIYIADMGNNCIRKISSDGIISTVAGNGTEGYAGDGANATKAKLSYPYDVATDRQGNIYIAEFGGQRIRKVNADGIISTVAGNGTPGYSGDGGNATNAKLNYPAGVTVDMYGNIYVADGGNNRIRKINTEGIISTIAGKGTAGYSGDGGKATEAELQGPAGMVTDKDGNIYIVDGGNNCIRKINKDGIITTIAGDGNEGHCGQGGDAVNAELNTPYGIAMDASGRIYVTDNANQQIQVLVPIKH